MIAAAFWILPATPERARWMYIVFVAVAAALLGACSFGTPAAGPTLGGEVTFHASGGVAGVRQSLHIDDRGNAHARDDKRGRNARRTLVPDEIARLKAAFPARPAADAPRAPSRCRDCLQYTLTATIDGERHEVRLSAPSAATPYDDAVALLARLLREMLAEERGK